MKKLLIVFLLVLGGAGGYFALYQHASSDLRLAELKSDLDAMYDPLERLALLQIPSARTRLELISRAIVVREEMLRAKADHDHEKAVVAAGELLGIVPHHTEGIRTLRESGQIFYLLRQARDTVSAALDSVGPTQVDFEPVSFEITDPPNENKTELVKYIQKGLSELGHYYGAVDGVAGPGTTGALAKFQKSSDVPNTLSISDTTANEIARAVAQKKASQKWKEKKFFDVNRARELVQSAVELDPQFDRANKLAHDLDQAHEAIALLLSIDVVMVELGIVGLAAQMHETTASTLASAATSKYRSIKETYARVKPLLDESRRLLGNLQENVDESMRLIGTYKGNRSKEFFRDLKEFVQVVRTGTDALLVPTGNLMQFRQAANNTITEVRRAESRLEGSIPNSAQIEESVNGLSKVFSEYLIFEDPKTQQVIDANLDLYTA